MILMQQRIQKRIEVLMHESEMCEEEARISISRKNPSAEMPDKIKSKYCKLCNVFYVKNWGTHKNGLGHTV